MSERADSRNPGLRNRPGKARCDNCPWYRQSTNPLAVGGNCHLNPPTPGPYIFAETEPEHWCSHHPDINTDLR